MIVTPPPAALPLIAFGATTDGAAKVLTLSTFGAVSTTQWPGVFEVAVGNNLAYVDASGQYFLFGHLYDMKAQQKPWEIGKSFDQSAPMGPIHPVANVGHITKGRISLAVNGAVKQDADLSQMIWSVAEQVAQLSRANELKAGDIIFSGTPENVGPVVSGDAMTGKIAGFPDLMVKVA